MKIKFTQRKEKSGAAKGFSLIELIGVMAILALLAAAAGPTFIKRIDYAAKTAEKEVLMSLTNALVKGCLANTGIPAASGMPATIAQVLNCSVSQVNVNARGFNRLIIVDPAISIGGAQTNLQTSAGISAPPSNARVVILSTIAKALPTITPDAAEFADIWNTAADSIPSVLSSWGGRGEDLIIERVNFAPLFFKVLLKNVDPPPDDKPNQGYYSLQDYGIVYVGPTNQFSAYFMDGTLLTLYRSGGTLADRDTREIIHGDISFLYQKHKWSRRLEGSDDVVGTFGELASDFVKPPAPADPEFGSTQQAVLNLLYSFLVSYGNWAYGDTSTVTNKSGTVISPAVPPYAGGGSGSGGNYPGWAVLSEAQVNLNNFTVNLIK